MLAITNSIIKLVLKNKPLYPIYLHAIASSGGFVKDPFTLKFNPDNILYLKTLY